MIKKIISISAQIAIILFVLMEIHINYQIYPDHYMKMYHYLTTEHKIDTEEYVIDVPYIWDITQKIYNDTAYYSLEGDYRNDNSIQGISLDIDRVPFNKRFLLDERVCQKKFQHFDLIKTDNNQFEMYLCDHLIENNISEAYITDKQHMVRFIIYDYRSEDMKNLKKLLNNITYKVIPSS